MVNEISRGKKEQKTEFDKTVIGQRNENTHLITRVVEGIDV